MQSSDVSTIFDDLDLHASSNGRKYFSALSRLIVNLVIVVDVVAVLFVDVSILRSFLSSSMKKFVS